MAWQPRWGWFSTWWDNGVRCRLYLGMGRSRILGLDPGSKRIGVALSDELGWTAQPLETYHRRSLEADVAHIRSLVDRHEVREVVLGLPLRLNGQPGPAAEAAGRLRERLEQALAVPIVAWDERLTTAAAERMLIQADVSREKRKSVVDRVAAALLLQNYLDRCSSGGNEVDPLGAGNAPSNQADAGEYERDRSGL